MNQADRDFLADAIAEFAPRHPISNEPVMQVEDFIHVIADYLATQGNECDCATKRNSDTCVSYESFDSDAWIARAHGGN